MRVSSFVLGAEAGIGEQLDHRQGDEDEGQDRHREDDEAVAPVAPELLVEDGPDARPAEAHRLLASTSSSMSSR